MVAGKLPDHWPCHDRTGNHMMRRRHLIRSLPGLALGGSLGAGAAGVGTGSGSVQAAGSLRILVPANPGGGWDTTARALGKALLDSGGASAVHYDNKGGAAGTIGLAQFVNTRKGDPQALLMMGAVMLGGIITAKPPVSLSQATPLARLATEFNVFVVPADSPFKSMKELLAQLQKDPASVKWGGGSRGSTEHIAAALLARTVGVEPNRLQFLPFRGGGEAMAAVLGGNVTVGGSGYSEFAEPIQSGRMRAIAVTSPQRLKGLDAPTLKDLGLPVEIGNWRGLYGAPGITPVQRQRLIDQIVAATRHRSWQEMLDKHAWTPALLTGDAFSQFVDDEFSSLRLMLIKSGLL